MGGRVAMTVQIPTSSYTAKIMASPQAKLLNASREQVTALQGSL